MIGGRLLAVTFDSYLRSLSGPAEPDHCMTPLLRIPKSLCALSFGPTQASETAGKGCHDSNKGRLAFTL